MWSDADWVNTGLAGFGVLVAIVGLAAVFWQIRKATSAAEAAREAASEAMQAMAQRFTAADFDTVRAALRTILDSLQALTTLRMRTVSQCGAAVRTSARASSNSAYDRGWRTNRIC